MSTQPCSARARHPRPILVRVSYDLDLDYLWVLRPGEAIDGQLDDEVEELSESVVLYRRGPRGRVIGFGVDDLYDLEGPDLQKQIGPPTLRFDVPTFGLRGVGLLEVWLAARAKLMGMSTPDVVFFDHAIEAEDDLEQAEIYWRACLECGEMKAHFGLGYTLHAKGDNQEAYGHLRAYTEIVPRNAWAWNWRGRAAERIGERREATRCFRRALRLERVGADPTDAGEWLTRLERRAGRRGPARRRA